MWRITSYRSGFKQEGLGCKTPHGGDLSAPCKLNRWCTAAQEA